MSCMFSNAQVDAAITVGEIKFHTTKIGWGKNWAGLSVCAVQIHRLPLPAKVCRSLLLAIDTSTHRCIHTLFAQLVDQHRFWLRQAS